MMDEPRDRSAGWPEATPAAAADLEDLLQRYGRHLHALAYHLCGDADEAALLARTALARHCALPPADADRTAAPIRLYLGLIDLWRASGRRRARRRAGGRDGGREDAGPQAGPLHRALAALDPETRVVLVLRVAEGLDYEEIAAILNLPAETVRSRLLTGRGRVQARLTRARCPTSLERAMNLYLDGRLPAPDRDEFERHLQREPGVRESVEFHRGLTLEFAEEAPPPARDFADRVRLEFARLSSGGPEEAGLRPPSPWGRRAMAAIAATVGAGIVAAGVYLATRTGGGGAPDPEAPDAAAQAAAPDEATVEALRSLGYLAGGSKPPEPARPRTAPAPISAPARGRTASALANPAAPAPGAERQPGPALPPSGEPVAAPPVPAPPTTGPPAPDPSATGTPPAGRGPDDPGGSMPPAAEDAPPAASGADGAGPESGADPAAGAGPASDEEAPAADGDPGAPEAPPAAAARPVEFRVAPAPRAPDPGRDHQPIRSAEEWAAFAADPAAAPPAADFPREMIVVLRDRMGTDPPSRLAVVSVTAADTLVLVCRVEQAPGGEAGEFPPGQAVVLPATDLPIRVLVR